MRTSEFGAICDVSVLVNRASFERAKGFFEGGGLYLPSATYSWIARDKLIGVRGMVIGYSLTSQLVRDGGLLVVYLPELYDELARRMLFAVERRVPLTDLRASMLAAHMGLPLLTFDETIVGRLSEYCGARVIYRLDSHAGWLALREILEVYRGLSAQLGGILLQCLKDENALGIAVDELLKRGADSLRRVESVVRKLGDANANPGELNLRYLAWDLAPIIREYIEQHVLQQEVVRELCEGTLLLVAGPK